MNTYTASEARREFFELLKGASRHGKAIRIHYRDSDAVILAEEEYEGLLETLELLSIPGFRESIRRSVRQMEKGQTSSYEEVFGDKA